MEGTDMKWNVTKTAAAVEGSTDNAMDMLSDLSDMFSWNKELPQETETAEFMTIPARDITGRFFYIKLYI